MIQNFLHLLKQDSGPIRILKIHTLLFLFFIQSLSAQNISFNNDVPSDLTVCGGTETFVIEFINISAGALEDVEIHVALPDGINYLPGSIVENSSLNVQESDVSDPFNLYFSSDDVANNQTLSFTFEASADITAYNNQSSGSVFNNNISVAYIGDSESETTSSYNILYAALSITTASPMATSVFVGGTYTRTVTIVNGGYGSISSFVLEDNHDSNSSVTAVDLGVLNNEGNEITFSSSDFEGIGNGDGEFDQNEMITVTETITVSGCNSFQSELVAHWGCGGNTNLSNKKYPYTTVVLYAPDLTFTPIPSYNTCIGAGPDNQKISITNNGSGPANEVEVEILPSYDQQYTSSDITSIQLTTDEGVTALTATETNPAVAYDCLGADPKDGFTVVIPNIGPGETVVLDWDNYTCATTYCGIVRLIGWDFEADYTDMCYSKNYSDEGEGESHKRKNMKTFFESPSDLVDDEEGTYSLILTAASFSLPETETSYFEVEFDIPVGLEWEGTANDTKLTYISGDTEWGLSDIYFNTQTNKLVGRYPLPIPDGFKMVNSVFDLKLRADCTPGVHVATVGMQLYYIMDTDCSSVFRMPMTCYESAITQLHCPGDCEHGMAFKSFDVERVSMGISDNDQDGLPDATNSLDYSKIKTNRVMVSDTFQTVFKGDILTSATHPTWSYGYAQSSIPYGNYISVIGASVSIYDASSGQTLVCDYVDYTENVSGGNRVVDFDFSPSTLDANGCSNFAGFVLEDEDEVTLTATYKMTSNPGGIAEQVTIENDFYVSNTANGTAFQCNDWNGNFTVIGYYFFQYNSEQYNVKSCTKTISQRYYMSIGVCCSNYNGGNIFPFEYRNWGNVKNLRIDIPEGYSFVSGTVEQWRTKYTNASKKETAVITPYNIDGTQHYFDLESYHVENGGTLNHSDDGYRGTVSIEVKPECTVNEVANLPMSWYFTFQENDVLGGSVTDEYAYTADYLKYFPAKLNISSTLPTQEATESTVSWDVKLKSDNSESEYSWLYLDYIANDITILEVKNIATDVVVTPVNGFYQLGNLSINEIQNYRITADYNSCSTTEIKVISGYDCNGYPNSINEHSCPLKELMLYVVPQPSELQIKFNSESLSVGDCGNSYEIELEMLSAKLSTVENLFVNIIQPSSETIELISGGTEALYPNGGNYSTLTDPVANSGTYTITGADMDQILADNGLVGITDVTANIVKLKFQILLANDFKPGDFLRIEIGGDRPCGTALPTLAMVVDPNAKFESAVNVGLDEIGDDWAVAWGDYDNDGFVDVFVTDYSDTAPNRLYHNEGDGTFSKVTTGNIVTDVATSLGATWGDYDNDGDLDLFVGNNIGSRNFLYRNNGDGSFTKVINDPIVNYDGYSHGVAWADYDNDGFLDLFVTDYFSTRFNRLYHNNGDGTFSENTTSGPALENSSSLSGVWADYNNDGRLDLFVTNINDENNSLYKNTGNGNFEKITNGAIVNDGGNSVGASWGDYNNDGFQDLFVSNAGNQDNFLYTNNTDGTFTKVTSGDIVTSGGHSHGSAWGDYNNDGQLDLFVSNDDDSHNFFYTNNGDGTFTALVNGITEADECSFGAAWADYDNDMDIDLFVANREIDPNGLYINSRGKCQGKACITLVGSNSNKSAIGAKVRIKANIYGTDVWQTRELSSQSGGGVGGQSELKILFGLGDATQIDSVYVEWPSGYTQVLENINMDECYTIAEDEGGELCGIAYYDENNNCVQDSSELGIPNLDIVIQPGDITLTTDENGAYSTFVPTGEYTITQDSSDLWEQDCTLSHTVDVLQLGQSYCGNNFANFATDPSVDLEVEITTTPHRIGFENLIALNYCNLGTETATDVIVSLVIGDTSIVGEESNLTLVESTPAWATYDGRVATWNIGTLEIGECFTIFVKDSIPGDVETGTIINLTTYIECNEEETKTENNVDQSSEPAVGGFDPNDISVSPEGYIDNDQELIYTIRFQNVGNASVSNVRITDQLPLELDPESLQMGLTSHPYRLEVIDGNVLVWHFENINMPDSTANEAESHGYVIFKINPKTNLEEGNTIINKASIFFDNNEPIITNSVVNTIGEEPKFEIADDADELLDIFPNPAVGNSNIKIVNLNGETIKITGVSIHDVIGAKVFSKQGIITEAYQIEKGNLSPGCYWIRVVGENKKEYVGKLVIH